MMMDDDDAAQSRVAAAHDLRGTNYPCEFTHRFGRMEMIHTLTLIAQDANRATFIQKYRDLHGAYRLHHYSVINQNKSNMRNKPDTSDELNKTDWLELLNLQDKTSDTGKNRGIAIPLLRPFPCLAEILCLKCCLWTGDETGEPKKLSGRDQRD